MVWTEETFQLVRDGIDAARLCRTIELSDEWIKRLNKRKEEVTDFLEKYKKVVSKFKDFEKVMSTESVGILQRPFPRTAEEYRTRHSISYYKDIRSSTSHVEYSSFSVGASVRAINRAAEKVLLDQNEEIPIGTGNHFFDIDREREKLAREIGREKLVEENNESIPRAIGNGSLLEPILQLNEGAEAGLGQRTASKPQLSRSMSM